MSEESKTAEVLAAERSRRLQDAMQLKQPDRVPLMMSISYMLADMGGITKQELLEDPDKCQELLEKAALEFQPDAIGGPIPADPTPHLLLGDRMTTWPGHGVSPHTQYQFVENEFMKEDEYDAFLDDPTDWVIRTYLPRAFKSLEPFKGMPPLNQFISGSYFLGWLGGFVTGELGDAFRTFAKALEAVADQNERMAKYHQRMVSLGFGESVMAGATLTAPFDMMSDALRGMRGILLDILRQPEKLLAAQEKIARYELEFAINTCKAMGVPKAFLPLHRGSDGFMSIEQFEIFYWPQLKSMLETLVDNGITPVVFYEGCWDKRLEHLAQLPKAKTVGYFQSSDIFKVKEVLGETMCIVGGMPNSLLAAGPADAVRAHTKRVCETVGKNGGFIMSTAVGEMVGSDPEMVRVWAEATREFGTY
ncbi:MAG: hypothetical protein JW990_15225 [Thermoleophilia bacterium]|nr:hypothetical protein [Thermoleophilia bacterium]